MNKEKILEILQAIEDGKELEWIDSKYFKYVGLIANLDNLRVKPDPERQRQIEVEKAWNNKVGAGCNIQWKSKDIKEWQNYLIDRPYWYWEDYDYRVKQENPTKTALQEVINNLQQVINTL
jgi:hypothetical protein